MSEKTVSEKKNRIIYLDILRIVATVAVIVIHVSAQNRGNVSASFATRSFFNILDCLLQWVVPVFIMVSGAVFLDERRTIEKKKLYTRNILHIVTAYFCWSFIYALYQVHVEGGGAARVLALTLDGHYHLWFLFMIASLYVVTPFLRRLSKDDMRYLLYLSFILCFVIPTLIEIANVVTPLFGNEMLVKASQEIFSPYNTFIKYLKIDYAGYFVLGHFLHEKEFETGQLKKLYALSAAAFVFTVSFSLIISVLQDKIYGIFGMFTVNILFESIGVFVFIKQSFSGKKEMKDSFVKLVGTLSACSFGVYLVHAMIIEVLNNELSINTLSFPAIVSVPLISFVVVIVSLGITMVLKKIPVIKKYMV